MKVVYFAQAPHGGPIKIGNSYQAGQRLTQISNGLPYELVLVGQCAGALFRERFVQTARIGKCRGGTDKQKERGVNHG